MFTANAFRTLKGIAEGESFNADTLKEAAVVFYEQQRVQEEQYRDLGKLHELSARKIAHLTRAVEHLSAALSKENADTTYCG